MNAHFKIDETVFPGVVGLSLQAGPSGAATCNSEPTALSGSCDGVYSYKEEGAGYTLESGCSGNHYAAYVAQDNFLNTCSGTSTYNKTSISSTEETQVLETCSGKQVAKPLDKLILGKLVTGVLQVCAGEYTSVTTSTPLTSP